MASGLVVAVSACAAAPVEDGDEPVAATDSTAQDLATASSCPYTSVQIRVQPNTSIPWTTSVTLPAGASVHVGVFKNGWGVPIDAGGVNVFLVQGSFNQLISLNGWDAILGAQRAGTYSLQAWCGGFQNAATVTWH